MPVALTLAGPDAEDRARRHAARVDAYATPFLERRNRGEKHPVDDFLFTYYTLTPGQMRRWHPGAGVVVTGAQARERRAWKHYRNLTEAERDSLGLSYDDDAVTVDVEDFMARRRGTVEFVVEILSRTASRAPRLGCFGLHEWAMAYRSETNGHRHEYLDLRLGADGTDAVVEGARISCSHIDAFRFFAPEAAPLNELQPTRETQRDLEQPGCLHANMDVYKWAYKVIPLLPSELVADCFELAGRIRTMDMEAAPFDLSSWGYEPIRIETPAGRAEYVRRQQGFMLEAQELREAVLASLRASTGVSGPR
ncbi:3-methyladenine DNA glycosylase [Falsarthrobacter nasiphocae]|uniref:3-methyladenine DNA glycosylase n=1 Tax=Falsarthrobacter nasiphocae TaxID=189863 RepID=A0AAE3YDG7_9MICC|nr:3-methyladenine DNA glycosylase [Falsarthrobacter nasiphocae]MDR6891843.1 hypothetical protein [Falsarthrobacter nasiphocae]